MSDEEFSYMVKAEAKRTKSMFRGIYPGQEITYEDLEEFFIRGAYYGKELVKE